MKKFNAQAVGARYAADLLLRENQEEWVWYHCYQYFNESRHQPLRATDYNMLSLHLSVYLAQANMYHGSSFILQNGYKVHREAIEVICSATYHPLSGISCKALKKTENMILLFDLTKKITAIYEGIRKKTYQRLQKKEPRSPISQNLITKILLATLGCVPAFDSRAIRNFKEFKIRPQYFSPASMVGLIDYYRQEEADFTRLGTIIQSRGVNLPQMKLIDIILQDSI